MKIIFTKFHQNIQLRSEPKGPMRTVGARAADPQYIYIIVM